MFVYSPIKINSWSYSWMTFETTVIHKSPTFHVLFLSLLKIAFFSSMTYRIPNILLPKPYLQCSEWYSCICYCNKRCRNSEKLLKLSSQHSPLYFHTPPPPRGLSHVVREPDHTFAPRSLFFFFLDKQNWRKFPALWWHHAKSLHYKGEIILLGILSWRKNEPKLYLAKPEDCNFILYLTRS